MVTRHRPNTQITTRLKLRSQRCALRIIHIHHRGFQTGPAEQRQLGLPVAGHIAVVVQMVLREIGEHGHAHLRAA